MRVGRVEVAVEQSPVEVVHSRSGGRVPGQDRGHLRCHITWDMTCGASSYVLVAGDWSAVFRSRHSADLGDQPVDQKHGGVVGVMGGMVAATFIGIFFVPMFYVVVRRFSERLARRSTKTAVPVIES